MWKARQFLAMFMNKKFFKKLFAYVLLIFLVVLLKDFLGLFCIAFIFGYLAYHLAMYIHPKIQSLGAKYKLFRPISKLLSFNIVVFLEYLMFIGIVWFTLSDLIPKIILELTWISQSMPFLSEYIEIVQWYLELLWSWYTQIGTTLEQLIISEDYGMFLEIFDKVKTAWAIFLKWLLAFVLSFIFIVDKQKLEWYFVGLKKSNFKFLYSEYKIIFEKIVNSFGLILKAQSLVGALNACMTITWLLAIGIIFWWEVFPFIITLGLTVFIFWFIPVLWVLLSSLPIIFISYSVYGPSAGFMALGLIILIHIIEAYYLNPKVISSFFQIPVSLTFIILLVSEYLFGIIGLLVGVSAFYFIMWLLADMNKAVSKTKKKLEALK